MSTILFQPILEVFLTVVACENIMKTTLLVQDTSKTTSSVS